MLTMVLRPCRASPIPQPRASRVGFAPPPVHENAFLVSASNPSVWRRPELDGGRNLAAPCGDLRCAVRDRTPPAVAGTLHPLEDSRPRPRRRPRLEGDPRTRGKDPHLPARSGSPLPTKRSRATGDGPQGVLQVAGRPLGPCLPRGSRLSPRRQGPPSDPGPDLRMLAQAELLPRVRGAHGGRGVSPRRSARDAGPGPPMRVPAGERPPIPDGPGAHRRAGGFPRRAAPPLAVARRRLEL